MVRRAGVLIVVESTSSRSTSLSRGRTHVAGRLPSPSRNGTKCTFLELFAHMNTK